MIQGTIYFPHRSDAFSLFFKKDISKLDSFKYNCNLIYKVGNENTIPKCDCTIFTRKIDNKNEGVDN
jgi:hypothetical protein